MDKRRTERIRMENDTAWRLSPLTIPISMTAVVVEVVIGDPTRGQEQQHDTNDDHGATDGAAGQHGIPDLWILQDQYDSKDDRCEFKPSCHVCS